MVYYWAILKKWPICQWSTCMYLCGFVSSNVCCKSQYGWRYYELMLRNLWDLGIYLNMPLLKVEQGHCETAILVLQNFFRLLLWLQVFRSTTLNIFMIQMPCTVMQLFKGSYFIVDAASRHFWLNLAIVNGTMHVFMCSVSPASR